MVSTSSTTERDRPTTRPRPPTARHRCRQSERAEGPPRLALAEGLLADVGELAVRRGAEVDRGHARRRRRRPRTRRGTPRWWPPGRAPGCGRARGRAPARGCRRASGRPASPSRRRAPARATPCPRRRCPRRSCRSARPAAGAPAPSSAARRRTSSVSSSSRHGGAHSRSTVSRVRWSATAKERISSTSSPQNSTRSGCSSVGGKTSTIPPRTANSPRRSTRSTREYAASARPSYDVVEVDRVALGQLDRLEVAEALDLRLQHRADRRDDHPERTVAARRCPGGEPAQDRQPAADGVAARAEPLVRQRLPARVVGDECRGRAGQPSSATRSSASRAVAVTASTVRAGVDEALDHERPQRRRPGQVERGDCVVASASAAARVGSARTASASPVRCTDSLRQHDSPRPRIDGGGAVSLRAPPGSDGPRLAGCAAQRRPVSQAASRPPVRAVRGRLSQMVRVRLGGSGTAASTKTPAWRDCRVASTAEVPRRRRPRSRTDGRR